MSESGQSAATMTKQEGLDASGFLLLGLKHLEKARDIEAAKDFPPFNPELYGLIYAAMDKVSEALELLKQEKER